MDEEKRLKFNYLKGLIKMNEKELKALQDEEIEKVSGGFTKNGNRYCDKCGYSSACCHGLYPINGGHLCESCLKKFKQLTK